MDNYQMPQAMPQPSMPTGGGSIVAPKAIPTVPVEKKDHSTLIFIIVIVFLSVLTVTFFGLFVWKWLEWNDVNTDVGGQKAVAAAAARDEQATLDEKEFLEREKYPYQNFSGPVDYGQLSFQYPKTWSLYVAADASKGGDFKAYFNPIQVDAVSDKSINALRVSILTKSFESVASSYDNYVNRKDATLSMESVTLTSGITANRYKGTIKTFFCLCFIFTTFYI